MEVASRYKLLTLLTLFTLFTLLTVFAFFYMVYPATSFKMLTWFTLLIRGMRRTTMGNTRLKVAVTRRVKEYFQIDCRTRVSRSIFKLTVTRGCPGVFSN